MVSVDALRGFDMFWLVGGTGLAMAVIKLFGPGVEDALLPQFEHVKWEGCAFYDVIYPLFVFVSGMSVVFSLEKYKGGGNALQVYKRIFRRFILLYLLGLVFYGGFNQEWPNIRLLGVLQRISLCYLFSSLLYYHFRPRTLVVVFFVIMIGVWALFSFVPVPGVGHPSVTADASWSRYIDEQYLPGRKYDGAWDNNGILGTIPATATCLLGVFCSMLLRSTKVGDKRKAAIFIGGGIALALLGWLWSYQLPVIKRLWTPSYVLVAGGYSIAALGLFYLVLDVWQYRKWADLFIWIGTNALTIYIAREFVDFNALAERFTGGSIASAVGPDLAYLLKTAVSLAFSLLLVRFLYKKKIFLRV
jgi:predicted acyltransferase